jgi:hypothetical protein
MANGAQTSIINAAVVAWQDALAACQRMPNLFLIATVALAALNLVYFSLAMVAFPGGPGLFGFLIGLIYAVAQSFLLTPLAIAVHRYLLLGETSDAYRLDPQDARFKKFFTFLAGLAVVMFVPRLIGELLSSPFGPSVLGRLVGFVLSIIAAVVLVRNVILFPAVAVDAPSADWRNAMADTQGHSWRVFFILFCAILPAAIVAAIVLVVFAFIPLIGWLIATVIQAAFGVFVVAATAAAASRLYVDYARLLGRPFGVANQSAA